MADQLKHPRLRYKTYLQIIAGNFTNDESIKAFSFHSEHRPDLYKVGTGRGPAVAPGCGLPTFSSVLDCIASGFDVVADGGIRNSGDIIKCVAAGTKAVIAPPRRRGKRTYALCWSV